MRALLAVVLVLASLGQALAQTGKRVVLSVGIGAYQSQSPLSATPNDARLIVSTLAQMGFQASGGGALVDPDKRRFDAAVAQFGRDIQGAEIAVFYFSGHGMQIDGRNWMIPTDGRSTRPADLARQHVGLHDVLDLIERTKPRLALIILDACRNNPNQQVATRSLTTSDQAAPTRSGLASVQAPAGTVIAFATAPDSVSADGPPGGFSPYTEHLVKAMRTPGLDMFRVFNTAAVETRRQSNGQQNPWVSFSPIEGEFFFTRPGATPAPQPPVASLPPPAPGPTPAPTQAQPRPDQRAADPSFYLVNLSGRRISDLRASLDTEQNWGNNRVQTALASPGQVAITLPAGQSCRVDLRVQPAGEKPTEARGIETCRYSHMMLTRDLQVAPADPDVTLVNATGRPIRVLRASLSSESDFGPDRLAGSVLPPGGRVALRFDKGQGCSIDIRAEFAGGAAPLERMRVETCAVSEFALK